MEKTLIGYLVFVSYNRNEYEINDIALDDMTFGEFVNFVKDDEVNCMSVEVNYIYNTTDLFCGGSEVNDDSVYWFISAEMAESEMYKEFFSKFKLK